MSIPIGISFYFSKDVLVYAGFDKITAGYTQHYITMIFPAMLFNSLRDSVDLFLISMGFNNVVALIQLIAIPIHLLTCWILVGHYDYGITGAAMATNLTAVAAFLLIVTYVSLVDQVKDAWFFPTSRTF